MSEDAVKWLRRVCDGGPGYSPLGALNARDLLSVIDARDAEIERLRSELQSVTDAATEREMALCFRLDKIERRPTPTLAEVAKDLMAGIYANPKVIALGAMAALDAVAGAEALLAELERRGAKCK